ncbi:hypothetical protein JCM8202_002539 [Rhodotorula sphaerocarpa]
MAAVQPEEQSLTATGAALRAAAAPSTASDTTPPLAQPEGSGASTRPIARTQAAGERPSNGSQDTVELEVRNHSLLARSKVQPHSMDTEPALRLAETEEEQGGGVGGDDDEPASKDKELRDAHARIARLEAELARLPSVSAAPAQYELDRVRSEIDQLVVQARTLARKLAESEAEVRRLLAAAGVQQDSASEVPEGTTGASTSDVSAPINPTRVSGACERTSAPPFATGNSSTAKRASLASASSPVTAPAPIELDPRLCGSANSALPSAATVELSAARDSSAAAFGVDASRSSVSQAVELASSRVELLERENKALELDKRTLEDRLKVAERQISRAEKQLRDLRAGMLQGVPLIAVDHELALPSRTLVEQAQEIVKLARNGADTEVPAAESRQPSGTGDSLLLPPLLPRSTVGAVDGVSRAIAAEYPTAITSADSARSETEGFNPLAQENLETLLGLAQATQVSDQCAGEGLPRRAGPSLPPPPNGFAESDADRNKRRRKRSSTASQDQSSWELEGGRASTRQRTSAPSAMFEDYIVEDLESFSACSSATEDCGLESTPEEAGDDHLPSPPAAFSTGMGEAGPSGLPYEFGSGSESKGGKPLGARLSALDVLAQASASQEAADSSKPQKSHRSSKSSGAKAKQTSAATAEKSRNRSASSIGPDGKKVRSPYIKWNVAEDEMLVRAVIECGCAWDNVARLCPTRAYHQVRQRFLRGLKSGHALPPELMHLQPQLLQSVQDHATKRKRKKLAKQAAQRLAEDAMNEQ